MLPSKTFWLTSEIAKSHPSLWTLMFADCHMTLTLVWYKNTGFTVSTKVYFCGYLDPKQNWKSRLHLQDAASTGSKIENRFYVSPVLAREEFGKGGPFTHQTLAASSGWGVKRSFSQCHGLSWKGRNLFRSILWSPHTWPHTYLPLSLFQFTNITVLLPIFRKFTTAINGPK